MADRIDAYAVLQVVPSAHPDVIRAAYRALARCYHPDRSTDPADAHRMIELNAAFELVGTPARRTAYDLAVELAAAGDEAPADEAASGAAPASRDARASRGSSAAGRGRARARTKDAASTAEPAGSNAAPANRATTEPATTPPPAGPAIGSILDFGRYKGWSLGQIARVDSNYLEWFRRTTIGRRYQAEIEDLLEPMYAPAAAPEPSRPSAAHRRGWLRRRG